MRKKSIAAGIAIAFAAFLTGCGSGEPGEADIRDAVAKSVDEAQQQYINLTPNLKIKVVEVHKGKCISAGTGFKCAVTVKVDTPAFMGMPRSIKESTSEMLFIQSAAGKWAASNKV